MFVVAPAVLALAFFGPRRYRGFYLLLYVLVLLATGMFGHDAQRVIDGLFTAAILSVGSRLGSPPRSRETAAQRPMRIYDGEQDVA